jgi:tetratricopeptide (TPR) repeat protein
VVSRTGRAPSAGSATAGLNDGEKKTILFGMDLGGRRAVAALALGAAMLGAALVGGGGLSGCSQVRGRKMIQDANELYKRGRYQDAVALFERAEPLVPQLPVLWLNKGYTCRQLIAAGSSSSPQGKRAVACALDAFGRLQALQPGDARGEQLYVQTLFDANDYPALEAMFLAQNRKAAARHAGGAGGDAEIESINGLQQVYFRWGKWTKALFWSRKAADIRGREAEAQYRVGVFIWQILSSRGGGAERASFDPRPRSAAPPIAPPPPPPPPGPDDITGALRVDLADEGIRYLEKALALRPTYPEAVSYVNLLYRQKSFAYFAEPDKWQAVIERANDWQKKALAMRGSGGDAKL